jgi:two-component system, chemotaxis family, CheB/CheR fusion protein
MRSTVFTRGGRLLAWRSPCLPSQLRVVGDIVRLQQVLWNLLKNASKFTPEGGEIRVTSRNETSMILVEIPDTGIGI